VKNRSACWVSSRLDCNAVTGGFAVEVALMNSARRSITGRSMPPRRRLFGYHGMSTLERSFEAVASRSHSKQASAGSLVCDLVTG